MNHVMTSTVGLDTLIQGIQTDLYDSLKAKWEGDIQGYGLVFKNNQENSPPIPEVFIGEEEYKEVYLDDNTSGNFFFIDKDTHSTNDEFLYKAPLKCAFMLNLSEILPNENDRNISKAHKDVISTLQEIAHGRFTITGLEKGVENVFRGLDWSRIKLLDLHPNHVFAVSLEVNYNINC